MTLPSLVIFCRKSAAPSSTTATTSSFGREALQTSSAIPKRSWINRFMNRSWPRILPTVLGCPYYQSLIDYLNSLGYDKPRPNGPPPSLLVFPYHWRRELPLARARRFHRPDLDWLHASAQSHFSPMAQAERSRAACWGRRLDEILATLITDSQLTMIGVGGAEKGGVEMDCRAREFLILSAHQIGRNRRGFSPSRILRISACQASLFVERHGPNTQLTSTPMPFPSICCSIRITLPRRSTSGQNSLFPCAGCGPSLLRLHRLADAHSRRFYL